MAVSVTVYVTLYAPGIFSSTLFVEITVRLFPSTLSSAVAPGSVNVSPCKIDMGFCPKIKITGGSVSETTTVLTTVDAAFPAVSEAL